MNEYVDKAQPLPFPESGEPKRLRWGLIAGVFIFFLTKAKLIIFALTKAKFLTTPLSMLVSISAYALIWGWKFALGFVLLLLVHEMGHVFQLRREGVKASAPMFIPFLGALIMAKSMGRDAAAEARVGLAGPILGTLGALLPLSLWLITGEEFFQALAFIGFFLNLFNLLPVVPLDGGRAMAAVSSKVWFAGFAMLLALAAVTLNPIMLLIIFFASIEGWSRFRTRNTPEGKAYLDIPGKTRAIVALTYFLLVVFLTLMMYFTYLEKPLA
jgi:Zn-dependent protease